MSNDDSINPLEGLFGPMQNAAVGLHEMYLSLVNAGFTPDQALSLINNMIASGTGKE